MPVILGALIYVFCGYSFYAGVRHPFFLNPMIYLPLILLGLEKVLERKKPIIFVFFIFISAISNFYFFYMLTILVILYFVFRYIYEYQKQYSNSLRGFILTGLRLGGYYLLGLAMSAFIFLPVVYAFMQNGRSESNGFYIIKSPTTTNYFRVLSHLGYHRDIG